MSANKRVFFGMDGLAKSMSVPTSNLSERLRDHSLYVNSVLSIVELSSSKIPRAPGS